MGNIVLQMFLVCASLERILDKKADYVDKVLLSSRLAVTVSCYPKIILIPFGKFSVGIILHIEVEEFGTSQSV